jgi:predicted small secreted protein
MKRISLLVLVVLVLAAVFSSCRTDADVASHNLSEAADNFEGVRRVVFFNGITDTYLLSIEGRICTIGETI